MLLTPQNTCVTAGRSKVALIFISGQQTLIACNLRQVGDRIPDGRTLNFSILAIGGPSLRIPGCNIAALIAQDEHAPPSLWDTDFCGIENLERSHHRVARRVHKSGEPVPRVPR